MTTQIDAALRVSRLLLWILLVLNIGMGLGLLALLAASFLFPAEFVEYLRREDVNVGIMIPTFRVWVVLALPMVAAVHVQLTRMKDIVETVRAGNPFVMENAARLRVIAWALLVVQVLHLVFGVMVKIAETANAHMDWEFSLTGWLAVFLLFVLARVFEQGARIRGDLEAMI